MWSCEVTQCQASLTGLLAVSCNIVLCRWRTDVLFFLLLIPGAAVNFCKQPSHCVRTSLRQHDMVLLLHSQQRNDSLLHLHICPDWLLSVLSVLTRTSLDASYPWLLYSHLMVTPKSWVWFSVSFCLIEYITHLWFGIWKWNIVVYKYARSYLIIILRFLLLSPLIFCSF